LEAGGGLFGSNAYYSSFDATQGSFSVLPGTGELGLLAFGRVAAGGLGLRVAYLPNGRDGLISDDRAEAARAAAIADGTAFSGPEMIISIDMDVLGVLRAF
jgi:hypothetical protein